VSLTDLAEGAFVKIALIVFVAGFALRLIVLLARRGCGPHPPAKRSRVLGAAIACVNWAVPRKGFLHRNPAGAVAALVLHFALFGVLLFNEFHVMLIWEDLLGLSWEPVSEGVSGLLAIAAALSLAVLLVNRLARRTLRALSTFEDYFAILLVG
jgi:nitrate reductase gamma subunit